MKKISLSIILMLVFAFNVHAEVYVISNPETDEVISISKQDDCVGAFINDAYVPVKDLKKTVLDTSLENLEINDNPAFYKFKNGKFIYNVKKVSDIAIEAEKAEKKKEEMEVIENAMKLEIYNKMKTEGKKFEEVTENDFK